MTDTLSRDRLRVLGLCGLAGSGKSYVARLAVTVVGAVPAPFAMPFKQRVCATNADTFPLDEVMGILPKSSETRHRLQQLGTELGRAQHGVDYWVDHWRALLHYYAHLGVRAVVVDDVRFHNEVAAIHRLGGEVWRIIGPKPVEAGVLAQHESETTVPFLNHDREFAWSTPYDDAYLMNIARHLDRWIAE